MTELVLAALHRHAHERHAQVALQDQETALTYGELLGEVQRLAALLARSHTRRLAILADNSCGWALADLAAHVAGTTAIPLPLFFSAGQLAHALRSAGVDLLITDQPGRVMAALPLQELTTENFSGSLVSVSLSWPASCIAALPPGTTKITFTSGTTGEPKGVCLGREDIEAVSESLRLAGEGSSKDRHVCLLPLATLLENVAGLYTPLLAGATICVPGLSAVGLIGSSGLDAAQMLKALHTWGASTAITVPQTLQALVSTIRAGGGLPPTLRYVALGGAPVAPRLLDDAHRLGIPVYEGYGLSECASVVAVNGPGERRPGSVGRPLRHVRVTFAPDGEIRVHGVRWRGYSEARMVLTMTTQWLPAISATGMQMDSSTSRTQEKHIHHLIRTQRGPRMGRARTRIAPSHTAGGSIWRGASIQQRGDCCQSHGHTIDH